ncbi:glycoprotein hormone alpha-2 isoform X4 [Octodon degus]|uniref:Glycoprotein hormone alpha-2 isoform X4 n=1 Tax=Octodon degus TaxID=10160 RepID=A0A6P3VDR9_OCTDE|nr:glycoprotein hormone alpha-2 isoform X4 [Octodon degus]
MSLKPFTYPFPETRFLHAGPSVYKFKIRYGHSIRGEEIANKEVIIQELEVVAERNAAGGAMKKRKLEEHSTPGGTGLPRAKMGSSSQRLSRKKPPMETRRNRKRKPQQEKWKTVASDTTDDQKQDSKWGHNLPGAIVPPLQQNNSPPSKDLGIQGFFGLLSTLFPFRYFFKKNSQ